MDATTQRHPPARHVFAVITGNALEFYDFTCYSYFASQIGAAFFPSKSPIVSLLASLAAFGIGFLGRPVGGILIGAYGDRRGRRPAMLLSFALMGVAILAFVFLPPFSAIGIAAPIAVVAIRFVQGIAVGGDVGPTTAFLLEVAPARRRGLYTALQYSSQGGATLLAGVAGYTLSQIFDAKGLEDYGWRIAFAIGAVILPFAALMRRSLPETHEAGTRQGPLLLAPRHWRTVALGFLMLGSTTVGFYIIAYLTTYAQRFLGMKANVSFAATLVFGIANMIFSTLAGHLSDRFGRKKLMVIPRALFALAILPAFWLIVRERSALTLLGAAFVLGALGQMAVTGFVALSEALPKEVRSASLATIYATAISLFGGTAQFAVTWLIGATGDIMMPAYYLLAATLIGLVAMALMDETAPAIVEERQWTQGPPVGRELI
ncbi:MAG: MFS transporter [Alphaproteobacteria bacterium]|nr:MFS transporter [Alphaproteobacteria bacterium]MBV9694860.1 MFS transporter [Alphaproteobacteria bacterium]